jgi:hypothetical protein
MAAAIAHQQWWQLQRGSGGQLGSTVAGRHHWRQHRGRRQCGGGNGGAGSGSLPARLQRRQRQVARWQRNDGGHGRGSRHSATARRRGGNQDTGGDSNGGGTDNNQQSTKSIDDNGNQNGDNDDNGNKGNGGGAEVRWQHLGGGS